MSSRILILVEGEAEDTFVREVLGPHLFEARGHFVSAGYLAPAGTGIPGWPVARKEFLKALKHDSGLHVSSMVDYYGMQHSWPGRTDAGQKPKAQRASHVENAVYEDVAADPQLDGESATRFHPYVSMHEFEALLFSDTSAAARGMGHAELAGNLAAIRAGFGNPEDINDSADTAPGKRLEALFKSCGLGRYQKPLFGTLAALEVGLHAIRSACPHFNEWCQKLHSLP
jgi:hypothetical protein